MHAILWIVLRRLLPEFRKDEAGSWSIFCRADFLQVLVEGFQAPKGEEIRRSGAEDELGGLDCRFGNDGLARWRVDQHIAISVSEVRLHCFDDFLEPLFPNSSYRLAFNVPCGGFVGELE